LRLRRFLKENFGLGFGVFLSFGGRKEERRGGREAGQRGGGDGGEGRNSGKETEASLGCHRSSPI